MVQHRRVLANGRSSGKLLPKAKKVMGPPKGGPWTFHTRKMLTSPAWKELGINARRFLDFLEIDHMSHGGVENGNLMATYDQLHQYGISRDQICPAIEQTIALGFVRRTSPRVERVPMTYRLTYHGTISDDGLALQPSNEWKSLDEKSAKVAKEKARRKRKKNSAGT